MGDLILEVNGYKGGVRVRLNLILSGNLGPMSDMWYILQHISKPFFYILNENTLANCLNFLGGKNVVSFLLRLNLHSRNNSIKMDILGAYCVPDIVI